MGDTYEFAEPLPEQCPPANAHPLEDAIVIRLATQPNPAPECFLSYAALGRPIRGDIDPCRYASCSVYVQDEKGEEQLNAIRRLPRFKKFKHAFLLKIDPNAGLALVNAATKHVDLWMFKGFDPVSAVVSVQAM